MRMRRPLAALLLLAFLSATLGTTAAQQDWEALFKSFIDPQQLKDFLHNYTSAPHLAGTPEDYATAVYTKEKWQEFGIHDVVISEQLTLLNFPIRRSVSMLEPIPYHANLTELPVAEDPTSNDPRSVPTFNGFAPSGNVTGQVVYANYGRVEDYEALEEKGIKVADKVVLVRYGGIYRGTKVMIAQERGAIGVLIYSDPADDGYSRGPVFPDGPWRPESGVQRGSAMFLSICPGDPRRKICTNDPNHDYRNLIPKIPVQPLSWGDALPILQNLHGDASIPGFAGGLNITYRYGPGPAVVNIDLEMNFTVIPIWNVIGTIKGNELSNQNIILGNHRDAWVFGAVDPSSGSACLNEVARGFGKLLQLGWKPKRTITLASWDAEEQGLIGSTNYGEELAETLKKQAVVYFNLDSAVSGPNFGAGATPSLLPFLHQVLASVTYPNSTESVDSTWKSPVERLGSGSDYTVFLDHLGIPSVSVGFSGRYGVYHSIYDSYTWMDLYGDPTYEFHRAMTQIFGLLGIRMADATVLPFNFIEYSTHLDQYFNEVQTLISQTGAPVVLDPLKSSIDSLMDAGRKIDSEQKSQLSADQLTDLNNRIMYAERKFIYDQGLPHRPWFRHMVQAPGIYLGYGADVFPGIFEAVQDEDWETANQYVSIVSKAVSDVSQSLYKSSDVNPKNKKTGLIVGLVVTFLVLGTIIAVGLYFYIKRRRASYAKLDA